MAEERKQNKKMIRVQVPIREDLKELADNKAHDVGFGSLQEVIRLFIAGFVRDEYTVGFNNKPKEESK